MSKEETLTIQQFKAWLEGVEEMQEEGWTPSEAQWTKIRAKIAKLCEDIEKQPAPTPMQIRGHTPMPMATPSGPMAFPTHNPRPLDNVQPSAVVQQSALEGELTKPAAAPKQAPEGGSTGGPAIKTPNIDTSNGNYSSGFE